MQSMMYSVHCVFLLSFSFIFFFFFILARTSSRSLWDVRRMKLAFSVYNSDSWTSAVLKLTASRT